MPSRRAVLGAGALTVLAACVPTRADDPEPAPGGMAVPGHELLAMDAGDLADTMRTIRELGCEWVRFDFFWDGLEPQRGQFAWQDSDRLVAAAEEADLRVLGLIHTTPEWLRPEGTPHVFGPVTDEQVARWAFFCRELASHYRGRVAAWELWNEPNLIAFWSPSPNPADYGRLVTSAWPVIQEADPDAIVVTGGPGGPSQPGELDPLTFLRGALDAGIAGNFHAIGLHPYTNLTGSMDGALSQARDVAEELESRGLTGVPLWGTETGAPTRGDDGPVVSEAQQATLVTDTFDYWRREVPSAGPLFWYTLHDTGGDSRFDTYGVVRANGKAKPALEMLRNSAPEK